MLCPNDQTELVITDRQGVEIDYCPKCRGVWLDRGELDKIIDRSSQFLTAGQEDRETRREPERDDRFDPRGSSSHSPQPVKKKKSSLFSELFDF